MTEHLIRKLRLRDRLDEDEGRVLMEAIGTVRDVGPNETIIRQGSRPSDSTLVLEGYTCRETVLSGGERQITAIHLPGDFVDLHCFLLKPMDHSITTLTRCRIALVPHSRLLAITEEHPHLTRMLWLSTLIDAAIHRRWLTAIGRQPAIAAAAHLLCELYVRQLHVGITERLQVHVPLSQSKLGDALGLSAVHINRIVRELREGGYVAWDGNIVTIKDWDRLVELAEFDPAYLNPSPEPR